ncbi:unnamed protein product [Calicophoron daubneyi]|uniref:PB1 domain-containing protein n=1 Tax=Calicophoron daubneyi TaxID=300641 RepID=A0AAV2TKH2_CALDB
MYVFKIVTPSTRTETKTEVTRWVAKKELGDELWDDLTAKLQKIFGTRSSLFYISWFDGSDYCTVRDYTDLEEAVAFTNEQPPADKAVRIYASPDKREHHTIFGEKPLEETPEATVKPTTEKTPLPPYTEDLEEPPSDEAVADESYSDEVKEDLKPKQERGAMPESDKEEKQSEVVSPQPVAPTKVEETPKEIKPTDEVSQPPTETVPQNPPATDQIATPVAAPVPVPVPVAVQPTPAYPYGQPYGYPNCYVNQQPQPLYPMVVQQWPTQPTPSPAAYPYQPTGNLLSRSTTVAETAPRTPVDASAPSAPASQSIYYPVLEEPAKRTTLASSQPRAPQKVVSKNSIPPHGTTEQRKAAKLFVQTCTQKLRSMGYAQDDKVLRKLIIRHKGNLNEIIDDLEAQA